MTDKQCPYSYNGNACSSWELFDDAIAVIEKLKTGKKITKGNIKK